MQPFEAALAGVDRRLVEASHTLGVSRLGTFLRVMLPLAWPGVLAGAVLTFAHTLGEFGVVLMVGGNIPGRTRTLTGARLVRPGSPQSANPAGQPFRFFRVF